LVRVVIETTEGAAPTEHDLVLVVDQSGSMASEISPPAVYGKPQEERDHLQVMDVVQHAARTVVATARREDSVTISVVGYSNVAETLLLHHNLAQGCEQCYDAIGRLTPGGGTNLWAGIRSGLNCARPGRSCTVLVLTDGLENQPPPRGTVAMVEAHFGRCTDDVNLLTFGFGYQLAGDQLDAIARAGGGRFHFIPDGSLPPARACLTPPCA
jgi:Mg-chelatase subunit ChlD